jgi:hypothetical protein
MSVYIKKTERSQRDSLVMHIKLREKMRITQTQSSRQKEIINIPAEITEKET